MPDRVIHEPMRPHRCHIGWKLMPLPDDHGARAAGATSYWVMDDGQWDPPGTVRECGECGRTWVGYKAKPGPTHHLLTTQWRPEGRFERWWRTRRARRALEVAGGWNPIPLPDGREETGSA